MTELRRAIYTKEYEYDNIDGTKSTIKLLPLSMDYIPFLFSLSKKFKEGMSEEETANAMDEETTKGIMNMTIATIKRSLPSANDDDINDFVIQHWLKMFPIIVQLNSNRQKV
jgi:hypothetical protein